MTSFWQYESYAGIRRCSLEKKHQTTVGMRVMRTVAELLVTLCHLMYVLNCCVSLLSSVLLTYERLSDIHEAADDKWLTSVDVNDRVVIL